MIIFVGSVNFFDYLKIVFTVWVILSVVYIAVVTVDTNVFEMTITHCYHSICWYAFNYDGWYFLY